MLTESKMLQTIINVNIMSFTDRFIKVPIQIFNLADKELTGKEVCIPTYLMFNPFELTHYHPSFDDEAPQEDCVQIHLKNGYQTLIYLSIKEFENLLNKHNA